MTVYNSNLAVKKMRHRGIYSGKPYEVAGVIHLAAGTVLSTGDILNGVPVGENQRIKEITVMVVGDADDATMDIGRLQLTDANGDPVVVERMGPYGADDTRFESPTSDPDAYDAAVPLVGYTRTQITSDQAYLAGPVMIAGTIVTGDTLVTDCDIYIGAVFDGETSNRDVLGGGNDGENAYLIDPDQGVDATP